MRCLHLFIIFLFLSCVAGFSKAGYAEEAIVVTSATDIELEHLPLPQDTITPDKTLSLQEAIILALRNNPSIHSSRFQRISDKYALELANYAFQPHFNFTANVSFTQGEKTGYNVNPGINMNTRWGTQIKAENTSNLNGEQRETFTIMQPLLGGFGAVNQIPWLNAQDNEIANRQNFKNSIMQMITEVTTDYRQVVQDYNSLEAQERALKREQETAQQYDLRVSSGKMAPSELLQQRATLANSELETERLRSIVQQDYQTLLDTLGLSPKSQLKVETHIVFKTYTLPTLEDAIQTALNNNPAYVIQQLQLHATRRAVLSAQDQRRWRVDVTGTANLISSNGFSGIINNFSELTTTDKPTATVEISIPIRDIESKVNLIDAKVALVQAEDSLEQSRRTLIRQVTNDWNNLTSQRKQLTIAEEALDLQRKNLEAERIKQQYGQTTALSVNIIQDNLLQQELDYINSQISYLNAVTTFQNLLGTTLKEWNIVIRY